MPPKFRRDAKTNEHKAALELLEVIPLEGKLMLGDAMFCQRNLSRKIRAKKGDWLWPVKENQPDLLAALADAFDDQGVSPRERKLARAQRQTTTRCNKGHGRVKRRSLTSTTALNDYADWPGVAQCFKLVRQRTVHGRTTSETVFGITSLPRERADAPRLLKLTRAHWQIENRVFHIRDVTMGEDGCRVRSGAAPMILSAMRNVVLNLLNRLGVANKAAALRPHAADPHQALKLVRPAE